jgi:hypothetical protein
MQHSVPSIQISVYQLRCLVHNRQSNGTCAFRAELVLRGQCASVNLQVMNRFADEVR